MSTSEIPDDTLVWQMTRGEFHHLRVSNGFADPSENSRYYWREIEKAISEGRELDLRVLREYELIQSYRHSAQRGNSQSPDESLQVTVRTTPDSTSRIQSLRQAADRRISRLPDESRRVAVRTTSAPASPPVAENPPIAAVQCHACGDPAVTEEGHLDCVCGEYYCHECYEELTTGKIPFVHAETYASGHGCPLERLGSEDPSPWEELNVRRLEDG